MQHPADSVTSLLSGVPPVDRRRFLVLAGSGAAAALLAACGAGNGNTAAVGPGDPAVGRVEGRRRAAGATVVDRRLSARPLEIDLAGRTVATWAFGDTVPGPEIRVRAGDVLRVELTNDLPEETTIHWHGIALRNDMDGVPGMTQPAVRPGDAFTYEFSVPDPGTYFFHPHVGLQLDRGLYAPLIVEDPDEQVAADVEHVLVIDDWLDGIDGTPEKTFAALRQRRGMNGGGMGGMGGGTSSGGTGGGASMPGMMTSSLLGGDAGDVAYPLHLLNGRPATDRPTLAAPASARVRLRIINAGSDTAYRFAVGGHRLTVTHADGFPVEPVQVDTLVLGMGERYDVIVTASSGAWPVVAVPEGKPGMAAAVLRTTDAATSEAPAPNSRPGELDGRLLGYADLVPVAGTALATRRPDRRVTLDLTGGMMRYDWGIGGKPFPDADEVDVEEGQRLRIELRNRTMMWHPLHLHGHTFAVADSGARKDTVNVLPGETRRIDVDADNPGQWMLHCHNTYHLEAGMATAVSYRA